MPAVGRAAPKRSENIFGRYGVHNGLSISISSSGASRPKAVRGDILCEWPVHFVSCPSQNSPKNSKFSESSRWGIFSET
jgi:hypothetical protein